MRSPERFHHAINKNIAGCGWYEMGNNLLDGCRKKLEGLARTDRSLILVGMGLSNHLEWMQGSQCSKPFVSIGEKGRF